MQKRFCSLQEGSIIFSLSAVKLKAMAQNGQIPATKMEGGKKWLIDIEAMTALLRERTNCDKGSPHETH